MFGTVIRKTAGPRFPLLTLGLATLASAGCTPSSPTLTPSHAAAVQDSVRAALADFGRYAAVAQWDSLLGLYSTDSSFRWIENGTRHRFAAVRQAMTSMPPGVRVETTYDSTEVVPLAPGLATLTTYYETRFVGSTPAVHFGGAISMIWAHEPAGWRIRGGQSASRPPSAAP